MCAIFNTLSCHIDLCSGSGTCVLDLISDLYICATFNTLKMVVNIKICVLDLDLGPESDF